MNKSKTIRLAAAGIFFSLCLLEIGMRILGYGILAVQENKNEILTDDSSAIRILTVGESTTADFFSTDRFRPAWPRQLEKKLQDLKIRARVYNAGSRGTTTSLILERLPEQLDHFRPHIVISMMGINDSNFLITPKQTWWENLRIVKLYLNIVARMRQPDIFPPANFADPETTGIILKALQNTDTGPAMELIEKQTEKLNETQRSQYYHFLAGTLREKNLDASHRTLAELLVRSLKSRFQGGLALNALVRELVATQDTDKCFNLALDFTSRGWIADNDTLWKFSGCARLSQTNDPKSKGKWWSILDEMAGYNAAGETDRGQELTTKNHRNFHRILADRKILHIEMQYATRPIEWLKNYFSDASGKIEPEFQDIIFVENKMNFESALRKHSYEEVFYDRFAGNFGHTTGLGHSVIADAVRPAVMEAIIRCGELCRQ